MCNLQQKTALGSWRKISALAVCCLAIGCTVGPDHAPPPVQIPQAWNQQPANVVAHGGVLSGGEADSRWWAAFHDPLLDRLIAEAASENLRLRESGARILEARARRGVAVGGLFPNLDATYSYSRSKLSGNGNPLGIPNAPGLGLDITRPFDLFSSGFDASWEIDVFGRVKRAIEASDAEIDIAVEDYKSLAVSLLAEIAAAYVEVRSLQQRIEIAKTNIRIQQETLALTKDRFEAGAVGELDVAQAVSNLRNTEAVMPTLNSQLRRAANRLCVLRGRPPYDIHEELNGLGPIPSPPPEIVVGLPADLLRRRPDIAKAEREVAAQSARVGVAIADLYPQFSLTGAFTLDSMDLSSLFASESIAYRLIGPSIRWKILSFGRVHGNIKVQDARLEQAMIRYEQSVLHAIEEVENALASYLEQQQRVRLLSAAAAAAKRAEEIARTQYQMGRVGYQSLLEAQTFLMLVEQQHVAARSKVSLNLIALYKALGGGWEYEHTILAAQSNLN